MPTVPEPIQLGRSDLAAATVLEDVTAIALANSPQIREADNQAAAARARALQASFYPNPTFGTASPQLAGDQSQYNAYIIQDVVTRNKIGLDTAAAGRQAREAELAAVRARFDVLTTVRQRFYVALVAEKKVVMLDSMVKIARTSLDISERLLLAEAGTRGDVLLLQIEYSRADAELKNAVTLAATTKRQLAAAVGWLDMPIVRVDGDLKHPLPDYELIALQQGVIARNANAQSAEVEISRTQFALRRAIVEPFPNLNMMGGYQNQQPAPGPAIAGDVPGADGRSPLEPQPGKHPRCASHGRRGRGPAEPCRGRVSQCVGRGIRTICHRQAAGPSFRAHGATECHRAAGYLGAALSPGAGRVLAVPELPTRLARRESRLPGRPGRDVVGGRRSRRAVAKRAIPLAQRRKNRPHSPAPLHSAPSSNRAQVESKSVVRRSGRILRDLAVGPAAIGRFRRQWIQGPTAASSLDRPRQESPVHSMT